LLGLRDHFISPFTTGYERTGIESLYPSNTDIFRKARAQGAVTGYVHAFSGDADPLEGALGVAKAFPVDAALGAVDCLEWSSANRATHLVWRHALNNDLRIVPVGGEDSISDLHWSKLIGSVRTYVYLGGAPLPAAPSPSRFASNRSRRSPASSSTATARSSAKSRRKRRFASR
jgi:hypothetical protein